MEIKYSNVIAEQNILGEIIMNNDKLNSVIDFLEPKHFAVPQHEKLYLHILQVIAGMKVDSVTLSEFFKYEKSIQLLGGVDYMKELLSCVSGLVSIRDYGRQVVELWKKREVSALLTDSLENLGSKKFEPLIANLINQVSGLSIESDVRKTVKLSDVAAKVANDRAMGIKPKIIPSNLKLFDEKLNGGFYGKRLYVLAAGAGTGKTSLSVQLLLAAAKQGKSCLFFSMEMDETEIYFKSIAHMASIPAWKMQRDLKLNQAEDEAKTAADNDLQSMPIFVNGTDKARVNALESLLKRQLDLGPVDLVIVDYIQIIDVDQERNINQADLIKRNTTALKNMAKKYDVAVVALSQIKRNDNKEPTLEDLKGSGGIGEDADMVMILYSPDKDNKEKIRDIKMIVRKNRWGALGEIEMRFDGEFGRFTEIEINNF